MNKHIIAGRLTKDAELKYLPNSGMPKIQFTVAVDRKYQADKNNKKTDFIPCEYIGKHTEKLVEWTTKGKLVAVEGELHIDSYKKDDETKYSTKLLVDRLELLSSSKKEQNQENEMPGFQAIDDNDIPF